MSDRGFKRMARRRYNDLDVFAQTMGWGTAVFMDFAWQGLALGFLAWFVLTCISVRLESSYFPEYSNPHASISSQDGS